MKGFSGQHLNEIVSLVLMAVLVAALFAGQAAAVAPGPAAQVQADTVSGKRLPSVEPDLRFGSND